ncbi:MULTISPECIES: AbrB/MazE/SpoVT family DNA-binding domain-containing protein [unclassified Paenibacillus]|uniref:AbrB/MazE/SpoVT family DNA-binding domain-containing protein n=1 Tax=unclassified Paenibacillus TaxID=185978 RepID=UPI0009C76D6C|nr:MULTISPECIES: AbrB/MazE/SpoVT family DNA-binding domain-containing protein [unclassified Paenibacillus]SLK16227.1 transcriptional pleiotropic regulator of transition state genes [Paenibacillus sp. RU5A]SOC74268.1 transcriptional pleiotropic regulator of transition state genes [Paenibacillus sp. RU26A]SOC76418.1 transcriptional pleiotropic regulator of transition state genes [Paenibacillus sp. RU5M]
MKSTGIVRKLDNLGRIVLPKELRDTMEIEEKDPIEFLIDNTRGTIVLRKYQDRLCIFCGSPDNLFLYRDRLICQSCSVSFSNEGSKQTSTHAYILNQDTQTEVKQVRRKANSMERLLILLKENPKASQKELSRLLDLSQGRVSQLLKEVKSKSIEA